LDIPVTQHIKEVSWVRDIEGRMPAVKAVGILLVSGRGSSLPFPPFPSPPLIQPVACTVIKITAY